MKFVNVFAVIALLAIPDATDAKFAAIQQQVANKVQQSSIQNSIKSFGIQAPTQIKNFFKTKASAIGQPINSIYQASQASTSMPYQAVTEQPIGFVQSAKNSIAKGFQKLSQKPIAPQNIAAAQSNIAPQAAADSAIGFQASTPFTGIQTESAQIKNIGIKPAASIQQPINQNIQQVVGIGQPLSQAAYQAPQNAAAFNAPKASAWASAQNTPLNTQNVINQNVAQKIIKKESELGIQAAADQIQKAPMGFAAI